MSTTTKKPSDQLRAELRETMAELEGLRDELRVRVHLVGMDMKSAWDRLDARYLELRDAARDAKDHALVSLQQGLAALRKELQALREKIDSTDSG